ncbi:YraN family protein [Planktotalea sp.]|uniref:YraN family protein n=1 Tax=Planktotalea sp. TaxID=2029877 RepID=UPI003D6B7AF4
MTKQVTGKCAYFSGESAEDQVAAFYQRHGHSLAAKRWRGKAGEIDLIFNAGSEVVFVEVKKAKSFAQAAQRVSMRQQKRICLAAEEYLGTLPDGLLTPMRVDAAFVNGFGAVEIVENAISAF